MEAVQDKLAEVSMTQADSRGRCWRKTQEAPGLIDTPSTVHTTL